jgi:hypothetical protein
MHSLIKVHMYKTMCVHPATLDLSYAKSHEQFKLHIFVPMY